MSTTRSSDSRGRKKHPYTDGVIVESRQLRRASSSREVDTPLKESWAQRKGIRFEKISWEEALDLTVTSSSKVLKHMGWKASGPIFTLERWDGFREMELSDFGM